MSKRVFKLVTLFLMQTLTASSAYATLGETIQTVETDRQSLAAIRHASVPRPKYTIEEIQSHSVTLREYVSSSGVIFGIAWIGLSHPKLQTLLGSHYYGLYQNSVSSNKKVPGRRNLTLKNNNLVVSTGGHQRALIGRAFDPTLIPNGVTADEIK